MKIITQYLYEETWNNLNVIDLTNFKSIKIDEKIKVLQEQIDNNKDSMYLKYYCLNIDVNQTDSVIVSDMLRPLIDDEKVLIHFDDTEDIKRLSLDSYSIDSIQVQYDEDYEYNIFNEYNINSDTVRIFDEFERIEQCLSTEKDCSYIEKYSYSIFLEITIKMR